MGITRMDAIALVLGLTVGLVAIGGCSDTPAAERTGSEPEAAEAPAAGLDDIALTVPNMACPLCARSIELALRRAGLSAVEIDLETKVVTARFDPDRMTPDQVKKLVTDLGYEVSDVEAE